MKEKEKTLTVESDFIEDAQTQFKEWQDDLEHLEDKVNNAGSRFEQEYNEQISTLKRYLQDFEQQIDKLTLTESKQWDEQRLNVEESARKYHQAYGETIKIMKKNESESAGWLEGFTDRPPSGSAGWLEGFHTRSKGSEGWVEGMAERTPKSKGWMEGYEQKN